MGLGSVVIISIKNDGDDKGSWLWGWGSLHNDLGLLNDRGLLDELLGVLNLLSRDWDGLRRYFLFKYLDRLDPRW